MGALTALFIAQDFVRFTLACRAYGKRAELGLAQLPAPIESEKEALVVITGDRNRIRKGLELLHSRPNAWLLISGVSKKTSLAEVAALQAEEMSENKKLWERVIIDTNATSTVENAEETDKVLKSKQARRMVLITSDYHMERALRIFKNGLNVEIVPFVVSSELTTGSVAHWPSAVAKFFWEYLKWVALRFDIY